IVRGPVIVTRESGYVESARAIGASDLRIIRRHVMPNILGPILVLATLAYSATCKAAEYSLAIQPILPQEDLKKRFQPLEFTAPKEDEYYFCTCKRTKSPPFCDGAHKTLTQDD
ncbi:MAG TPA: ABC transporter permease subunit, partial [Chromatiaceae bacterium]|nr:ABC transporter permease subunit [Chromatiaceae bacterium]